MIIQWYTFKFFIKTLLGITLLVIGLFIIVKLMDQLNSFIRAKNIPFSQFVLYFLYEIPFTLIYLYPIAVAMSVVYTFGRLNSQNEMVAIYNTGTSYMRVLVPTLVFLMICSTVLFIFDKELLYIPHMKHRIIHKKIKNYAERQTEKIRPDLTLFGSENKIYFIKAYHPASNVMYKTHILYMNTNNTFRRMISAVNISFDLARSKWIGRDVVIRDWQGSNQVTQEFDEKVLELSELPYHFEREVEKKEHMPAEDVLVLAKKYKTIGGPHHKWYTQYYFKMATPYIAVVILFLCFPISVMSRKMNIVISFFIVISLAFFFFVLLFIGESLGNNQYLPPMIAGWFGHICFAIIAYYLWKRFIL